MSPTFAILVGLVLYLIPVVYKETTDEPRD